jgi:hypothetical protein
VQTNRATRFEPLVMCEAWGSVGMLNMRVKMTSYICVLLVPGSTTVWLDAHALLLAVYTPHRSLFYLRGLARLRGRCYAPCLAPRLFSC